MASFPQPTPYPPVQPEQNAPLLSAPSSQPSGSQGASPPPNYGNNDQPAQGWDNWYNKPSYEDPFASGGPASYQDADGKKSYGDDPFATPAHYGGYGDPNHTPIPLEGDPAPGGAGAHGQHSDPYRQSNDVYRQNSADYPYAANADHVYYDQANAASNSNINDDNIELRPLNKSYSYEPVQTSSRFAPAPPHRDSVAEQLLFATGVDRVLRLLRMKSPVNLQEAVRRKREGLGGQRFPVATWSLTLIMCIVMIYELVQNAHFTGSPIQTKPTFNYMIGPSGGVLINVGARFIPCMKNVPAIPPSFRMQCLTDTSQTSTTSCGLEEICGHGGFGGGDPNQSWRFIVPIFMHVGLVHLALNMFGQVTLGSAMERELGSIPFLMVYFAGGIYGFILGGNFALTGIPSAGASGAIFAIEACAVVDLIMHWKYEDRPKFKAMMFAIELIIVIGMGYIPFAVDGLAHLGGFAMGLLLGTICVRSVTETRRHSLAIWVARGLAVPLIILAFVLTTKNFYTDDPNAACKWCKFLSCFPTESNNRCTGTGLVTTSTTS